MTDIELLPLPEWMRNYTIPADGFEYDKNVMLVDRMHDYARANMAPLKAEIERLRAEREVIAAEAVQYADKSGRLEAKVDRLAEALREKADKWDRIGDEHGVRQFTGNDHKLFANELRALLRDHDQEDEK